MSNEKSEIEFVDGLIVKAPRDGAPDFIKCSLSIKRLELIAWLQAREGEWVNVDVKEAKSGKWYAAVDSWKPKEAGGGHGQSRDRPAKATDAPPDEFIDDIPFLSNRGNF
jgi:hypothetical protein